MEIADYQPGHCRLPIVRFAKETFAIDFLLNRQLAIGNRQ